MEAIMNAFKWLQANLDQITQIIAYLIAGASIIVKLTPTLKDDNFLKGVIKFIGKWIALDKYPPPPNP